MITPVLIPLSDTKATPDGLVTITMDSKCMTVSLDVNNDGRITAIDTSVCIDFASQTGSVFLGATTHEIPPEMVEKFIKAGMQYNRLHSAASINLIGQQLSALGGMSARA